MLHVALRYSLPSFDKHSLSLHTKITNYESQLVFLSHPIAILHISSVR